MVVYRNKYIKTKMTIIDEANTTSCNYTIEMAHQLIGHNWYGQYAVNDILNCILLKGNVHISIKILWVPGHR